jgi:selenide, water dikinase
MTTIETPALSPIRLTELTDCGGCAAKLGADLLADALSGLGAQAQPDELLAGLAPADDAAAYRISDDLAIIGTLDFFPPLVDDARTFGEIAAANALSDVFAMGGRVLFALSIAAFPEELPRDVLAAVFDGAAAKVREAGGTLAGGHTIRDPEPKYGLAVIGAAHPDKLLRKGGAQPGDTLILTKRLGTGLIVSGHRQGRTSGDDLAGAIDQMRHLNRTAAEVLVANEVAGATDVTGFGLLGHLVEMVRASNVDVTLAIERVPLLPGARETVALGIFSSLQPQNVRLRRAVRELETAAQHPLYPLLFDPQTAGGLLAAVPLGEAQRCVAALRAEGYADAAVIGFVSKRTDALEPIALDLTGTALVEVLATSEEKLVRACSIVP